MCLGNFILTAVAILFISGCGRAEKIARIEQKCANNEAVWCLKLAKHMPEETSTKVSCTIKKLAI